MLPTLFVAHGAPMLVDDALWVGQLRSWAQALPRPRALLFVSAHWETPGAPTLGATRTLPLIYDFYGFPERYYQLQWPAPGAPALAQRVRELLPGVLDQPDRGLDHGAYIPLMAMWPEAEVPTLQLSLPSLDPRALLDLGRALRPLRDEGVLIVGGGLLTHNLREVDWSGGPPASWARDFDAWVADRLREGDLEGLADFLAQGPQARRAHPRTEHFVPLFVAAGAGEGERVQFPIEGWSYGSFTKRSVQFG